jgi:hypothetical protein
MRVSQFKDFNQRFEFLKSKPPVNADTLQVCEHRRVVITYIEWPTALPLLTALLIARSATHQDNAQSLVIQIALSDRSLDNFAEQSRQSLEDRYYDGPIVTRCLRGKIRYHRPLRRGRYANMPMGRSQANSHLEL